MRRAERELACMIKRAGINFKTLPDRAPDPALGQSTGAATLFGNSDGVMEAALRLAYEKLSGKVLKDPAIKLVRTREGINTASIKVPDFGTVKVAVASGLENAARLCEQVRAKKADFHFIEIMTCPGGCVNGGGQPLDPDVFTASLARRVRLAMNRRMGIPQGRPVSKGGVI